MILKLAVRNIIGNGWRSLVNVLILSIVLIGMVWMQGLFDGWSRTARRQMQEWEFGDGHYEHKDFDKYDSFTWDKSNSKIPAELQSLIEQGKAVPILISAGVIYPQGRLTPITIKGIPHDQEILEIPTEYLRVEDQTGIILPAVIGTRMARSTHLEEGDILTMRWKDIHGAYNAYDIQITKIMDTPVPPVDDSQVWVDFTHLNEAKALQNSATHIVLKDDSDIVKNEQDFRFITIDESMQGTDALIDVKRLSGNLLFALLLFLAMIAIFDTQILAIFKRRREIGTMIALGMTKRQIVKLFTIEGCLYSVFAAVATSILGLPLFIYFGVSGYKIPQEMSNLSIAGTAEPIKCYYSPSMLLSTFILVLLITALASWMPTYRIARMKATDALLGKV
ncbi:MAG: FtsX-like permease family protein [Candidatus Cloacimonetes bacterium]|nr:FtsX-like permease family protein [Candidatus Cloacimonadota bacterium]